MTEHIDHDPILLENVPEVASSENLHLVFRIEDEDYALHIAEVNDIQTYHGTRLRRVPKMPNFIKGIVNIRGDVVPVICVRTKFMKPIAEYDFETCIVKVTYGEYDLGLIVDKVIGVETILPSAITSPPSAKLSYSNQFIKSVGVVDGNVRMILSLEKLIF